MEQPQTPEQNFKMRQEELFREALENAGEAEYLTQAGIDLFKLTEVSE